MDVLTQCRRLDLSVASGLTEAVASSVREVTELRADVSLVAPGSLANAGKVLEDWRSYARVSMNSKYAVSCKKRGREALLLSPC